MGEIEKMLAEHECSRLCTEFHLNIDAYQHDKVTLLFAPDAKWHHVSGLFDSTAKIRAYLDSKSTSPIVRHLVTNVLIDVVDADFATGTAYVTVFYAEPGQETLGPPIVLVTYHDEFRRTEAGWRFASRRPVVTLRGPGFGQMINTKEDERKRPSS